MAGNTVARECQLAADVRCAVMRLGRRLRTQRADMSLTLTQLATMSTLDEHGPLTPGELAGLEKVQPPSMTRVLSGLEVRGLVVRRPHPTDKRQVLMELTAEGTRLIKAEAQMREAWLSQRVSELSLEDRQLLGAAIGVLDRLAES